MVMIRARRIFSIIVASLALSVFSASCDREKSQERSQAQADKDRLVESRKAQQQTRQDLRDAVKSGASKDEKADLKNQVKEGQSAIVQDKKNIREQRLGSTQDQSETKQGANAPTE
jgi:septal ring factor EnvC (AmiA/AmiB activator)